LIGGGGYGEVWLAKDAEGSFRAVKIVFRESFQSEEPYEREYNGIKTFAPLARNFPCQVQILHVGRKDDLGRFYYIMELADDVVAGQKIEPDSYTPRNLKSDLKSRGRFPFAECLEILIPLASAVENLHKNGLVHRDIKPSNIIFIEGVPKLADPGLVTDSDSTISFAGTEGYFPKEGPGTKEADIYALGIVLYETCTGRPRRDFPKLPDGIEEMSERSSLLELNTIIGKACDPRPSKRYQSARAMVSDLLSLKSGGSVKRKRKLRQNLIAALLGSSVFVVLLASFWAYQRFYMPISPGEWLAGFRPLFNGRTLKGWDGHPKIWSVEDGVITGHLSGSLSGDGETFLIWTNRPLEDFELRISYKIARGNSGVFYRGRIVNANQWTVDGFQADIDADNDLDQRQFTGALFRNNDLRGKAGERVAWSSHGRREISTNTAISVAELRADIRRSDWNEMVVIADGNRIIHSVNGHNVTEVLDMETPRKPSEGILALQLRASESTTVQFRDIRLRQSKRFPSVASRVQSTSVPNNLSEEEKLAGFELLYNGNDLDGWKASGGNWEGGEGAIARIRAGGDLISEKSVPKDFELRFDWRIETKGRSGILYRPGQYEYQILDNSLTPEGSSPTKRAGALCFVAGPGHDNTKPPGQWNSGRIVCDGTVIEHWLNDKKILDVDYSSTEWTNRLRRLQKEFPIDLTERGGHLRLQDEGTSVWFRSIRVRRLD